MRLNKKVLGALAITGIVAGLSVGAVTAYAEEPTVVLAATSGVSNPFSYEKDGVLTGYDVEVLKAIFDRLPQYELQFEEVAFEGILAGLDNGRYQLGANNFSWNEEREEKYDFSDPYIKNGNVFVVRKDDDIEGLDDLSGRIAITEVGNSGATILENYNKENEDAPINIQYTEDNFVKQFMDIEAGTYDCRIISKVSAETAIAQNGFTNLKTVDFDDPSRDPGAYILFSKANDPQLRDDVNTALAEIIADGTLKQISEEQLGGDYSPESNEEAATEGATE